MAYPLYLTFRVARNAGHAVHSKNLEYGPGTMYEGFLLVSPLCLEDSHVPNFCLLLYSRSLATCYLEPFQPKALHYEVFVGLGIGAREPQINEAPSRREPHVVAHPAVAKQCQTGVDPEN